MNEIMDIYLTDHPINFRVSSENSIFLAFYSDKSVQIDTSD